VFDRTSEWETLATFAGGTAPGLSVAVMYGRRRMGKSHLLRHLASETAGFYYQALEQLPRPALDRLAKGFATSRAIPSNLTVTFDNWEAALTALCEPSGDAAGSLVVLDEVPYLTATAPEIPSVIQGLVDASQVQQSPPQRLVLCGSAQPVMTDMLAGSGALRGRVSVELVVSPFDYRTSAEFWGALGDPGLAFSLDTVVGGTPGYRDLLSDVGTPAAFGDFDEWLAAGVLDPTHALFREDEYLLAEDRTISDRALYLSIVGAVANGNGTQTKIASALGREMSTLRHPLEALVRTGFMDRIDDAFRANRPVFRLADPIVAFHHAVTRPALDRFEERETQAAWADASARYATHVAGPHFEHLCRVWTRKFASPETLGGQPTHVSPAVLNCKVHQKTHECDVVAVEAHPNQPARTLMLGEAKFTNAARTLADVARLEHLRDLVESRNVAGAPAIHLIVFAGNGGFDENLKAEAARRDDVILVDIERLYHGA
jgi:AAA+ ATPase superfamily predicted ATPase